MSDYYDRNAEKELERRTPPPSPFVEAEKLPKGYVYVCEHKTRKGAPVRKFYLPENHPFVEEDSRKNRI